MDQTDPATPSDQDRSRRQSAGWRPNHTPAGADGEVAIGGPRASPYRFGRKRCVKRDAERLTQIGGLVECAVPGLDEALRRRGGDGVPEGWSGIRRALRRGRERVPINDYCRLAAKPFVINESGRREDVRGRRRRGRISTAAAAARLIQQDCR